MTATPQQSDSLRQYLETGRFREVDDDDELVLESMEIGGGLQLRKVSKVHSSMRRSSTPLLLAAQRNPGKFVKLRNY